MEAPGQLPAQREVQPAKAAATEAASAPTGATKPEAGKEPSQVDQARIRMRDLAKQEGIEGDVYLNMSESPRFQELVAQERAKLLPQMDRFNARYQGAGMSPDEYLQREAEMRAAESFKALAPQEATFYEKHGVYFNEEGEPDLSKDPAIAQLHRDTDLEVKRQLREIVSQYTDPEDQLNAILREGPDVHGPIYRKVSAALNQQFRENFPEKVLAYGPQRFFPENLESHRSTFNPGNAKDLVKVQPGAPADAARRGYIQLINYYLDGDPLAMLKDERADMVVNLAPPQGEEEKKEEKKKKDDGEDGTEPSIQDAEAEDRIPQNTSQGNTTQ